MVENIITISRAAPDDTAEVSALDLLMWKEWANPKTFYRQLIDLDPESVVVARDSNRALVGFAVGLFNCEKRSAWVLSVDLHPNFRGCGFGSRLVMTLLDRFRLLDAAKVTAIIDPENESSQRLFSKLGFQRAGIEQDYFETGKTQEKWELATERRATSHPDDHA